MRLDFPPDNELFRLLILTFAFSLSRFTEIELHLTINGTSKHVNPIATVEQLLAELELDPRAVVVELNREIVRRPSVSETPVRDGDVVEIVHFVGGG